MLILNRSFLLALLSIVSIFSIQTQALGPPPPDPAHNCQVDGPWKTGTYYTVPREDGKADAWYASIPQLGISVSVAFSPNTKLAVSNTKDTPIHDYAIKLIYGGRGNHIVKVPANDYCNTLEVNALALKPPTDVMIARVV